jgi:hypothetical protein
MPLPTVAIFAKLAHLEPWQRSTLNPVSLLELSAQLRLIWLLDTAMAFRLVGAAGDVRIVPSSTITSKRRYDVNKGFLHNPRNYRRA